MSSKRTVTSELQKFIQQRYEDAALVIYRQQHSGSLSRLRVVADTGTEIEKQHSPQPQVQCWQDEQHAERQANQIVQGAEFIDGTNRDKKIFRAKRVVESENDLGKKSVPDSKTSTQSRICAIM